MSPDFIKYMKQEANRKGLKSYCIWRRKFLWFTVDYVITKSSKHKTSKLYKYELIFKKS